jgi:broad specificity phosphatase PhoE
VRGRTFIVFRHAEKATEISADDPPLTAQGKERARRLATMLGHAGVTRLVASSYRRTQETLAPLAEESGRSVEIRPMIDHVAELVADLRASPDGSVVAVASHSNVLPRVVRELGGLTALRGVTGDSLPDPDYGRVYVITLPCGTAASVLELSSDP